LLLLATKDTPGFEAAVRERAGDLEHAADDAMADLRVAVRIDNDPMAAAAGGRTVAALHAIVEATVSDDADDDALVGLAKTVGDALRGVVDWQRSAVALGTLHTVLPAASDELVLVLAAHRLPTLSQAEFGDYWLNCHAALALSLLDHDAQALMGYEQLHTDESASAAAAAAAGAATSSYDGVLEVGLAAIEHLPHATNPEFAKAIADDEQNFADQSAVMCGAFLRPVLRSERRG